MTFACLGESIAGRSSGSGAPHSSAPSEASGSRSARPRTWPRSTRSRATCRDPSRRVRAQAAGAPAKKPRGGSCRRRLEVRHARAAARRSGPRVLDRGQEPDVGRRPDRLRPVHGHEIPKPRTFRAYAYRPWSEGFAYPLGPASIPGPLLEAEVGDVLRVHFRNADEHFGQAVTLHPHGVKYTPDYDAAYLGEFTRVGGFIAPGEEFTYTWEAVPRLGRRVALPRPRAQRGDQHPPRPVRQPGDPREGRPKSPTRSTSCTSTRSCPRSPSCARTSSASTGAWPRATRRR